MAKKQKQPDAIEQILTLVGELPTLGGTLTDHGKRKWRERLTELSGDLVGVIAGLDKCREPESFFDPANPRLVGAFVGISLVAQTRHKLDTLEPFYGSGVYAIYYGGSNQDYAPLVGTETPIYVGKADPDSTNAKMPREQGTGLWARLHEDHKKKSIIKATSTLSIADFSCRYLVVQSGWQTAAEDYLIHLFQPVWNDETKICWGIGKHGDKSTTRQNKRSPWDTMHPGRPWATSTVADKKPITQIRTELAAHFVAHPPFSDADAILKQFYEGLKQV